MLLSERRPGLWASAIDFLWGHVTISLRSPASLPTSLFEKREELRRILGSKHFTNSPKKSRFLEFVSEQAFLGNGDKLNEYLIGVEVYDRGPEFDSQKDPIVRVQAHDIRRILKKYYEDEGKDSLLRLELPARSSGIPITSSGQKPGPPVVGNGLRKRGIKTAFEVTPRPG